MVFFYLFLVLGFLKRKLFKSLGTNEYFIFFDKNINLKKKIFNPADNDYYVDYRTEQEIASTQPTKPILFTSIYKNYKFFKNKGGFNDSFSALLNKFELQDRFLAFSTLYIFLYYRFFRINYFFKKSKKYLNRRFADIVFIVLYFFKDIKFGKNTYLPRKYTYWLYNYKIFRRGNPMRSTPDVVDTAAALRFATLKKNTETYSKFLKKYVKFDYTNYLVNNFIIFLNKKINCSNLINFKNINLKSKWKIIFNNSFLYKFISNDTIKSYNILFLRKNRIFNKGRYSRNRQNYRTGVYWCLYVNIIAIMAIYYFFYRFSFNFGYFWWLLGLGVNFFFFNKFVKFKLYNFKNFLNNLTSILYFYKQFFYNISLLSYLIDFLKSYKVFFFLDKNKIFKSIHVYFITFYIFLFKFLGK